MRPTARVTQASGVKSQADVTVVLAHGAWADSSSWNKVIAGLRSEGVKAIAAPLPLTILADDAGRAVLVQPEFPPTGNPDPLNALRADESPQGVHEPEVPHRRPGHDLRRPADGNERDLIARPGAPTPPRVLSCQPRTAR